MRIDVFKPEHGCLECKDPSSSDISGIVIVARVWPSTKIDLPVIGFLGMESSIFGEMLHSAGRDRQS